jgi:hypothetical protein
MTVFCTILGRQTLSRSHNDLNTTDDSVGTENSPHQLSCGIHTKEFQSFVFDISYDLKKCIFDCT